jgi:hypothetical protein
VARNGHERRLFLIAAAVERLFAARIEYGVTCGPPEFVASRRPHASNPTLPDGLCSAGAHAPVWLVVFFRETAKSGEPTRRGHRKAAGARQRFSAFDQQAALARAVPRASPSFHETFSSWRENQHDDIVLALSLACWYFERVCRDQQINLRPVG